MAKIIRFIDGKGRNQLARHLVLDILLDLRNATLEVLHCRASVIVSVVTITEGGARRYAEKFGRIPSAKSDGTF